MPEATDALCSYIESHIEYPHKLIVVDNGSDLTRPSKWTTVRVSENVQTTAGWLMGLSFADYLEIKHKTKFFAYWILITSTSFLPNQGDILAPLAEFLQKNPKAAAISHALTEDSTTYWKQLYDTGTHKPRQTWMLDNISTVYRASWFNKIGRFDPKMYMAWGSDLETSYLARKQGKSLWVYDGINVKKTTDIGYKMNRMKMSALKRKLVATKNMVGVLEEKYGKRWRELILNKNVY